MRALMQTEGLGVRTKSAFASASRAAADRLGQTAAEISGLCETIFTTFRAVRLSVDENNLTASAESLEDIRFHLKSLVYHHFVALTPYEFLRHYPRYLQGLARRIEKLKQGGARDADKVAALKPHWQRYVARVRDHLSRGRHDDELDRYRWMIEEYRISLFAQEIGTAYPISPQRLDRQWSKVAR